MLWMAQGLLSTYTPSISVIFLIHSRLVWNQWVSRSRTTS